MARSPLFRFVRRSLRLAQRSLRSGESSADVVDREDVSRRAFLKASVGAAALAATGCRIRESGRGRGRGGEVDGLPRIGDYRPTGPLSSPVVVIGAGIAGLTAAYRLMQADVPVRVFEAQNRTGGRMFSLRNFYPEGQVAELGGELINSEHRHIRSLASELEIPLDDLASYAPMLEPQVWYFKGRRYSDAQTVEAFKPLAKAIRNSRRSIGGDGNVSYRTPNGAEALDRMSIAEWLDGVNLEAWMYSLLDAAFTSEFGLDIDRQSALNLLLVYDLEEGSDDLLGWGDERYHVRDGNDRIPSELARRLAHRVELNRRLVRLRELSTGSYSCTISRGATSQEVRASLVILTLPFTLLREVAMDVELPRTKIRAIRDMGYGTNIKLMTGFSRRLWRTKYRSQATTLSDLPFQSVWETSRLQPGASGILTNFRGGKQGLELGKGTAEKQASLFLRDYDRVFPGITDDYRENSAVRFHWPSFPFAKGSYGCYMPGQLTSFGGVEGERVRGVLFAGELCSSDNQGYMEGGCETGEAAARQAIALLAK